MGVKSDYSHLGQIQTGSVWEQGSDCYSLLHIGLLICLLFNPESGGDKFFQFVGWRLPEYIALYPRGQNYLTYSFNPEGGGDIFLQNVSWNLFDYTAPYLIKQNSSVSMTAICMKSTLFPETSSYFLYVEFEMWRRFRFSTTSEILNLYQIWFWCLF
jgi:hypothetical protein